MHDQTKGRFALDLDEFERELKQVPASARPARQDDPLAELARIVGQDDPFRDMLAADRRARPAGAGVEPRFDAPAPAAHAGYAAPAAQGYGDAGLRGTVAEPYAPQVSHTDLRDPRYEQAEYAAYHGYDAPQAGHPAQGYAAAGQQGGAYDAYQDPRQAPAYDERYEAYYEQQMDGLAHGAAPATYADDEQDLMPLAPRRSRKGLIAVGAVMGLAVIGVAGFLTMKGGPQLAANGEPPIIKADAEPAKVQPQNPGGVEIPNQNKQIYERGTDASGATKVVSREEQPVDVALALRSDVIPAAIGGSDASTVPVPQPPQPTSPAVAALGEPKRVRTVSVRPDGTIVSGAPAAQAPAANPVATDPKPTASTPAAAPKPAAPRVATTAPGVPLQIVPPTAQPQQPAEQPRRVASVAPTATAEPAAPAAAGGGFAVQLAAPGSEKEARDTFAGLQRKYADLAGYKPLIRKADVGERTIYRLRVGPFASREEATSFCVKLQASGGQCFVAKN